jgi:hypothetical protein
MQNEFFTREKMSLLPRTIHQLLLSGAWLFGSRAAPDCDWALNTDKDWDLCIEPQDWGQCSLLLASSNVILHGHTRFGGFSYIGNQTAVDIWISTIGETISRLGPGTYYAANLKTNAYLVIAK